MSSPRTSKRPVEEYKELLRIDWDWSSTGIWVIKEPNQRYTGSNLDYGTEWLESSEPWNRHETQDDPLIAAYKMSLGIDLKRVLGDNYYVECSGREIHDDLEYLKRVNKK